MDETYEIYERMNAEELLMSVSDIRSNVAVIEICVCVMTTMFFIGIILYFVLM